MIVLAGVFIGVCTMLPLVLFHLSAPAMALAVLGGLAVGLFVTWIFAMVLLAAIFHD